jgi:LuxR family transcriptional regulator, maltose regulon positive regulatory protein
MSTPILATKLYIPPPQPNLGLHPRLIKRLNDGLHRKLTLISTPAGFGKSTRVSEWINQKAVGESWAFYIYGSFVELVLTALIVWYAWKWP